MIECVEAEIRDRCRTVSVAERCNQPDAPAGAARDDSARARLVRRVNQLYHDLTQDVFDVEHRYRHRVERSFWHDVSRMLGDNDGVVAGRTVVDLACGTGFVTQILAEAMHPQDRLIAIDISPAALDSAARKCRPHRLQQAVADGARLPLADESVDLFAINAALHHMPDPIGVLQEVDRVLKPAGLFALGFEPNLHHFRSPMARVAHGVDRLAWYANPRQNVRRFRAYLGLGGQDASCESDRAVCRMISECLQSEGLIDEPLNPAAILDMVDAHARGAAEHAGFDAVALIEALFPKYELIRLVSSDYLGEAPRRFRPVRSALDAVLRMMLPAHGSLFSMVVRKCVRGEEQAP
ncbi:MAG TPA: class I SAM-dependent methyltransferase [Phycisphaerae bacterium]|nr:class I SAM-dependent methyltransferase [Phycisphaerae bacterium]HOM49663.1 class I SAM-dependent methyltransferase [Phycisphaerae bacterium]HPU24793.1 class I SAM-dependent methyltransferase [Phycisphaerae bacterium]HPZ97160.1 class I SAM-dependent methyltransferase [Phycisphaerae bacterium]HQE27843.1 class I SAM-dependent methyltransferase [Phycisphaerae bacterium]